MTTKVPVVDVRSVDRIGHDEAMAITAVENQRFADLLRRLGGGEWTLPTDCPLWDVKDVVAHIVGSAASQASPREFARQVIRGRPLRREIGAAYWWDGMNEVQVRERAELSTDQLIAEWDSRSTRALRARTRMPRPIARLPLLALPMPVGRKPLRYLFDIGFTRDVWAHRIDIAVATGTTFEQDAGHDGRLVADLVAEWAGTHGEPFVLELAGPAGGTFSSGGGGELVARDEVVVRNPVQERVSVQSRDAGAGFGRQTPVSLDVIEFARTVAGRRQGEGLLRHPLPL
ncbi:MAG: maleylpyruvate isomerase family mycothiol-dependent enzyme [Nakamurella sp.]